MSHDTKGGQQDYLILAGILLLALVLRIWGLNAPLWYDEIMTVQTHLSLPWGDMMQSYSMNHHYLFSLQAKSSMALFGDTNWALRLPAMVFGLGSIAGIWWLARDLARDLAGRHVAHITALLLAISYHHIWFSQNARGYSELAFLCTLAMILFLRGIRQPTVRIWVGYGICLALAVFTHLTGAFFFIAQGLVWLVIAIRAAMRAGFTAPVVTLPALGYLVGGVLTLVFYAPILPSVIEVTTTVGQESATNVLKEYESPLWTILEAARSGVGDLGPLTSIIALLVITLIVLGGLSLWRTDRIFAPTVLLHIPLTMLILSILGMRIWPRFFFADIGFLMLLIVLGVRYGTVVFARLVPVIPARPLYIAAVAAMVILSAGLASRNYMAPKQDLAGAIDLVERIRTADDRVYSVGAGSAIIFNDQYGVDWGALQSSDQFSTAINTPGPIYFVVMFPSRNARVIPEMGALAQAGTLDLVNRFAGTLGDGAIAVFRRN